MRRVTVHTAPHFGIRYESDLNSRYCNYVIDSVDTINKQILINNLSFFFDTVDVCQQVIGESTAGICLAG